MEHCFRHWRFHLHKSEKTIISQCHRLNQTMCSSSSFIHAIDRKSRFPTIGGETDDPLYIDMPTPRRKKSERKPYPTPMNVLIRRAKEERQLQKVNPCRVLEHPPDNGLLVPELVDVAHKVYYARASLLIGISKLIQFIPIQRCRFCFEVHVGLSGHDIRTCTGPSSGLRSSTHVWRRGSVHDVVYFPKCYHLNDRAANPRVIHNERSTIPRLPAILELCIQAGVDLNEYPTKRRTKPVHSIEGRIVDFESELQDSQEEHIRSSLSLNVEEGDDETLKAVSERTMKAWFEMINGTRKIMEKYKVWTCGFCPEIQVGPKGHKVRMCKASKHQARDGMHAWQEATIEDLVGPNYVWHVRDVSGPPLDNRLKRYYGKAPALVELCVQAVAKRSSMFDDPTVEIQELTVLIKNDITGLNTAVADLQILQNMEIADGDYSEDRVVHANAVCGDLKNRLMGATEQFQDVLTSRTVNIKAQENRKQIFSGSASRQSPFQQPMKLKAEPPPWSNSCNASGSLQPPVGPPNGVQASNELRRRVNADSTPSNHMEMTMLQQTAPQQEEYSQARASALRNVESTITELGGIFTHLAIRIDDNMDASVANVDGAHSALLKNLHRISSNRSLMIKIFAVLIFFLNSRIHNLRCLIEIRDSWAAGYPGYVENLLPSFKIDTNYISRGRLSSLCKYISSAHF